MLIASQLGAKLDGAIAVRAPDVRSVPIARGVPAAVVLLQRRSAQSR